MCKIPDIANETVKYSSEKNGYTGVLYGKSSLAVFDKNGKEKFHTGKRGINTYNELVEMVESFPDFLKVLFGGR